MEISLESFLKLHLSLRDFSLENLMCQVSLKVGY